MRVLIVGHNVPKALKICKNLTLSKPVLIARDLSFPPGIGLSGVTNFPDKMKKFLTICKQGYHPGKINFYQYSPWSQKGLWQNAKSEQETLDQYHHVIGWNPDMVIYLFDLDHPSTTTEKLVYDTDNIDGVKIWRLNANDKQLKANLLMMIDV